MKPLYLVILSLFFIYGNVFSQTPVFKEYLINSENQKLKYNCLFFDHTNLMWIGTNEGLYEYDGIEYSLHTINTRDFKNAVSVVFEDSKNNIWVGYNSGKIATLKNGQLNIFNPPEGLPKKAITSILEAKNGTLWFTTAGEGVYFYKKNTLYNINNDDNLNDNYTYTSLEDKNGKIWIGTDQGIAICSDNVKQKVIQKITSDNGLPDEIVRCLSADLDNNIWVAMQDKGICKINYVNKKVNLIPEFDSWNYGQINALEFNKNELWLATENSGIMNYNTDLYNEVIVYADEQNFNFSKARFITFDAEGNVWITCQSSIFKSSGNTLRILNNINGHSITHVHAIEASNKGAVYFTPHQQLSSFLPSGNNLRENKFIITSTQKLIDISCFYEDTTGLLWIGTMGEGIFCFDPVSGSKIKIQDFETLNSASILSIGITNSQLWISTIGGVFRGTIEYGLPNKLSQLKVSKLTQVKELGNYIVYKVFVDSKQRIWFATDGKGVVCFNGSQYINYNHTKGLTSDVIYGITEDVNKNIWLSSAENGIFFFNGVKFKNYGIKQGLRELTVTSIIGDDYNNIIMVHQNGIDVLNVKSNIVTYFGAEFNLSNIKPDLNGISKEKNGNIWIGTEKGILVFNSRYRLFDINAGALIKKVSIFNNSANVSNNGRLKYHENNITINYAGIWYSEPGRVNYRYFLRGYSNAWVVTKDHKIVFPELKPGNYEFKLQTSLNESFSSFSESTFKFKINKAFWNQVWFRTLIISVLIFLALSYINWRDKELRKFEALEKEKIKFQLNTLMSQVNPHFLFNSFNTLIGIIETDTKAAVIYVEKLSNFFRNIVNAQKKDLITLKDELEHSAAYYYMQKQRFGDNLQLKFDIETNKNDWYLPPLVSQILIENAIKHNTISKEFPLEIYVKTSSNYLIISNKINLKRTIERSTKTGLKNIIDRYKLLNAGEIIIIDDASFFIVQIPLIDKLE